MNKGDLVALVSAKTDLSKRAVTEAVDATFDAIVSAVARGDTVSVPGFGTFEKRERGARAARNPLTGAPITIAATSVPGFRAAANFRRAVNGHGRSERRR